jgi:hypothetical protein
MGTKELRSSVPKPIAFNEFNEFNECNECKEFNEFNECY